MKITAKIEYACRAILELSLHWPNSLPLQVQIISKRQNIPIKFLIQILLHLKQYGIIKSVRGKSGGYLLTKEPENITLNELITYFDDSHLQNNVKNEGINDNNVMSALWEEVEGVIVKKLESINFEMICNRKRKLDSTVMFEI